MQDNAVLGADAYLAWWQLAGVECAVAETPVDWLRPILAATTPAPQSNVQIAPTAAKPQDLHAFQTWLASGAGQPEKRWAGRAILPVGPIDAPLMIVTDMPDPADIDRGTLLADRAGALLDSMLRAIGLSRDDCYIASLFFSRPPGGMVEAGDIANAATRMATHVHLARPRKLLLLGDRTIRALMPVDGETHSNALPGFKHDGGTVPVAATFHPRLLLTQPTAKAQSWRTLQSLIEENRP